MRFTKSAFKLGLMKNNAIRGEKAKKSAAYLNIGEHFFELFNKAVRVLGKSSKFKMRLVGQWSLCVIMALLAGCSTYHRARRDGPPNFYVDVSKIPDAVPKVEPPCRFANKPYRVNGHTYHVLSSSEGYDERGIASWYGTLFHKHHTSCGEPYNMLSMTAASTILPLPTYAQVTNLKNGRRVIVKVNDRGPFAERRIMDLSWAAAKKLGITGPGTGYVEVKAIDPRTWHQNPSHYQDMPKPKLLRPGHPILYLQVGALSQLSKARALGHKVAELTHRSVRIQKKPGATTLYRVQIGPLNGVEESDILTQKLERAGLGVPMPVIM